MFRCVTLLAACAVASALIVPIASADPDVEPVVDAAETAPAPPEGVPPQELPPVELVESSPPATTKSPDGWTLTLSAKDETQRVIQPLTTAISTREYEVGGVFNAAMSGPQEDEPPQGTLEVGYQIGCGIDMSTSNGVVMSGSLGSTPGVGGRRTWHRRADGHSDVPDTDQRIAGRGAEAGHHQHRSRVEEAIRGRPAVGADHRFPGQDRRLCRRVLHPLLRVPDPLDRRLRCDPRLLRG
jgi:hypothetical protein